MKKVIIVILIVCAVGSVNAQSKINRQNWIDFNKNEKVDPYEDKTNDVSTRVENLIFQMNTKEKVAQLCSFLDLKGDHFNEKAQNDTLVGRVTKHGLGSLQPITVPINRDAAVKNAIQKNLIENTRLGIPVYFVAEALHGLWMLDATVFPQAIGLASSWNPALVQKSFDLVACESRVRGHQLILTPVVDVARDPRWGRTEECYGEDPYLVSQIGLAAVVGMQGGKSGVIDKNHVGVTLKHFAGHSQPDGGVNKASVEMGERLLREVYMSPFQSIIKEANPAAIMPSYGSIDGVPPHSSKWLLQTVLREEFNFKGLVVSDWGGVTYQHTKYFTTSTPKESAVNSLVAGVDVDQPNGANYITLTDAVENRKDLITYLDAAVRRILRFKFEMGVFDAPFINQKDINTVCNSANAKKLAYDAAAESMVLLKNANQILPLKADNYKKVAVIGAHANDLVLGGYSGVPTYKVTLFDAIKKKLEGKADVFYSKGFTIFSNYPATSNDAWSIGAGVFATNAELEQQSKAAVEIAKNCDLVILTLGEDEMLTHETWGAIRSGDHSSLDLKCGQNELFEKLKALGKPVIVCLQNGRPLSINLINEKADAILECWYGGQEGHHVTADILFGDINPSGKLPITFPKSVGQIPMVYNHNSTSHWVDYVFEDNKPLYPFGFGLSYTQFKYGEMKLSSSSINSGDSLFATIDITNTGSITGKEIVQLYIHDKIASVERPLMELKDFQKIELKPNETKTISFNPHCSKTA